VRPLRLADGRLDEYAWLRDDTRGDRAVLAHLRAENRYTERWFKPLRAILDRLGQELRERVPPADEGLPLRRGDFDYYWRELPGREHPRYLRRPAGGGPEQMLLDAERRAFGSPAYDLGTLAVSPDGRWLAISEDHDGSGVYQLRIKDLQRSRWLPVRIEQADADVVWAADSRHLYYVHKDVQSLASLEVRCHRRGQDPASDWSIYRESDPSFYVAVYPSHSRRYIVIHAEATRRSRLLRIDAEQPLEAPVELPLPGSTGAESASGQARLRYDDDGSHGWLLSDADAPDFQLWRAPLSDIGQWQLLVPERPGIVLEDFLPLPEDRLVLVERREAQLGLRLLDLRDGTDRSLFESDRLSALTLDENPEPEACAIRVRRDALDRPGESLSLDFESGQLRLLKRDTLAGPFDEQAYTAQRCWVESADGVRIPISVLGRREVLARGNAPVWLYGYGAYGVSLDPDFDADRLSLLDRGVLVVYAHVRGGGELGAAWHDGGRQAHKHNSFEDFLIVTAALIERGLADPRRIFAVGGSAGGLLVAAALNRQPQAYCGALLEVPFVDVLSSMSDESLPLTQLEYQEWGDPRIAAERAAIAAWSPYDQLHAAAYPPLLVSAGLHDGQVAYWEPAKYVSRLRRLSTSGAPALLRVDLGAGHQGVSGRYASIAETAAGQAFALNWLGCAETVEG
jgi:oligopeptidase B